MLEVRRSCAHGRFNVSPGRDKRELVGDESGESSTPVRRRLARQQTPSKTSLRKRPRAHQRGAPAVVPGHPPTVCIDDLNTNQVMEHCDLVCVLPCQQGGICKCNLPTIGDGKCLFRALALAVMGYF